MSTYTQWPVVYPPGMHPSGYLDPYAVQGYPASEQEWLRRPDANGASGVAWKTAALFILGWLPAGFGTYGLCWFIWGFMLVWLIFRAGRTG